MHHISVLTMKQFISLYTKYILYTANFIYTLFFMSRLFLYSLEYSLFSMNLTLLSNALSSNTEYSLIFVRFRNNFLLSRDNSFFDTKFTSNEFRLQFNKNFDSMLDLSLVLRDADDLITSLVPEKLRAKETYQKISNCLFDFLAITNRKNILHFFNISSLLFTLKLTIHELTFVHFIFGYYARKLRQTHF